MSVIVTRPDAGSSTASSGTPESCSQITWRSEGFSQGSSNLGASSWIRISAVVSWRFLTSMRSCALSVQLPPSRSRRRTTRLVKRYTRASPAFQPNGTVNISANADGIHVAIATQTKICGTKNRGYDGFMAFE